MAKITHAGDAWLPQPFELTESERMSLAFALGLRITRKDKSKKVNVRHHARANAALLAKEKVFYETVQTAIADRLNGTDMIAAMEDVRGRVNSGDVSDEIAVQLLHLQKVASYSVGEDELIASVESLRSLISSVGKSTESTRVTALGAQYTEHHATTALWRCYQSAPDELHASLGLKIVEGEVIESEAGDASGS